MAGKRLSIALTLNDKQFQSGLRKATRSMTKFGKSMQRTGQTLSKSLTLPIAALGVASVKAFDAQSKAVAQVEAGLRSTGESAGFTSDQLQKLAADLQTKTLFGDEVILKDATAQLLTFTNITGEQFEKTQIAALNLATRLDGDLKSASIQLGKALNDPVANLSALSRAGIQFSAEQKETIKSLADTNRLAEAQNIILQELETQFGGAAEAAAKAGLGPFEQLRNALSDVSEEFGKLILENIEPLKKSISELTGFLRGLNTEQKQTALRIAGITAVAGPLLIVLGKLVTSVASIVKVFMKLTPVGRAISIVLAGITLAINPLKRAFESFTKTGTEFKNMVSTTGDVMKTSPLFDPKNYAKVNKEVKKTTKTFEKFREVASIEPKKAGPVSATEGQTSPALQFATDPEFFAGIMRAIVQFQNINDLTEEMDRNFVSFGGAIEQAFATALVSQGDFFQVFVENAKRALNQILAQIAAMAVLNALLGGTGLGGMLGFKDIGGFAGIPKLFGFADGGMVTGATLAMVGEGPGTSLSNPEVIAPLDKLQGMIGNAGGQVEVFGRLSGSDILLSSDRARGNRNRTRGY